jgi:site-specific recombinase XerD
VTALYRVCQQGKTPKGHRDLAIVTLMLGTGLRRSETTQLQRTDYNSRTGAVTVKAGKGNKERKLYLHKVARQQLRPWLKCRGNEEGALFNPISRAGQIQPRPMTPQAIYDVIRTRSTQAGTPCKPHDLRRTFVTRLLEAGVDLNTTRQLAGHSNVQTTVKYDLRDEQVQRKALKQLSEQHQ